MMLRNAVAAALVGLPLAVAAAGNALADAKQGLELARKWCSSCRLVAANQTGAVPQGRLASKRGA
jgi:hypothetical protein